MNLWSKMKSILANGRSSGPVTPPAPGTQPAPFSVDGYIDERRIRELDRRVMECLAPGGKILITPEHSKMAIGRAEAERIASEVEQVMLDFNMHEVAYYLLVSKFNFVRQGAAYLCALREQMGDKKFRAVNEEEERDLNDPFGLGDLNP